MRTESRALISGRLEADDVNWLKRTLAYWKEGRPARLTTNLLHVHICLRATVDTAKQPPAKGK